jgi:hypothetical protein
MALYSLKCTKCNHKVEKFVSISGLDNYLKENKCEECKGDMERDLMNDVNNISFFMKGFKTLAKEDAKVHKANMRKANDEMVEKDPYFGLRGKGD